MLDALKNGITPLESFLIFLLSTSVDILIGYFLGWLIKNKFKNSKLGIYVEGKVEKYVNQKEGGVKNLFILFIGTSIFPVSTIFAPWLKYSFVKIFFIFLISEVVLWYSIIWATVEGVNHFTQNLIYGFILVALILFVISHYIRKRF